MTTGKVHIHYIIIVILLILIITVAIIAVLLHLHKGEISGPEIICNYHDNEYHLWLKIDETTTRDYEMLDIIGYDARDSKGLRSRSGVPNEASGMTKSISKTIDLTQYIPTITDTAKTFPTRIGPDWHEAYIHDNWLYVHLQSGFLSGAAERERGTTVESRPNRESPESGAEVAPKRHGARGAHIGEERISISLILRNLTNQTTKEQTLPVTRIIHPEYFRGE